MIKESMDDFPFKRTFTLKPLIDYWVNVQQNAKNHFLKTQSEIICTNCNSIKELTEPIEDLAALEQHRPLLDALFTAIFPGALAETTIGAAVKPFAYEFAYMTPLMEHYLRDSQRISTRNSHNIKNKIVNAYSFILHEFYGFPEILKPPIIFELQDEERGYTESYQFTYDLTFCKIIPHGTLPELSEEDRARISAETDNFDLLTSLIPPEHFEFYGFSIIQAFDITKNELVSAIKNDLLNSETIISEEKFKKLERRLAQLIKCDDLSFSLVGIHKDTVLLLNNTHEISNDCIFMSSHHFPISTFMGSIYDRAATDRRPYIIHDLSTHNKLSDVEKEMVANNKINILIVPLYFSEQLVGILQLTSPVAGTIHAMNARVIDELIPLFGLAVKRSLDEFNQRIQTEIRTRFTAIHPSVTWRFTRAAENYLERIRTEPDADMEEIVFEDVYPLYGVSDIRSSSTHRNDAIRSDLIETLSLARTIIKKANTLRPLPILDELLFRIEQSTTRIETTLDTGDEIRIHNFLKNDIESAFPKLAGFGDKVAGLISRYEKNRTENGSFHAHRADFDRSVSAVNKTITTYLDALQPAAQEMYPHYFDKQVTDGVDQNMYIGASIAGEKNFDHLFLKNLRLWQLIVMATVAHKLHQSKKHLPLELDTTHLIMVQNFPLTIRFDQDENRFRVDGAYNIRYEIMKKRIDKATIKDSGERITQPGKIAIVYSQKSEADEYMRYLEYLVARGLFTDGIENYELNELQGISGLQALRAGINLEADQFSLENLPGLIGAAIAHID